MRPLVIVLVQPAGRAHRLLGGGDCRGLGGFGFEHAMPLFMRAVIFRMARARELDFEAQGDEPGAQARQACGPRRTKWTAIIHAQGARLTMPLEQADKGFLRGPKPLAGQHFDQQTEPGHQIPHRQGIHPLSGQGGEAALEINRPDVIGDGVSA